MENFGTIVYGDISNYVREVPEDMDRIILANPLYITLYKKVGKEKFLELLAIYRDNLLKLLKNEKIDDDRKYNPLLYDETLFDLFVNKGEIINILSTSSKFKTKYSCLFLPENTPQELKDAYYNKTINPKDVLNDEVIGYFNNTNIVYGLPTDAFWIKDLYSNLNNKNEANKKRAAIARVYLGIDPKIQDVFKNFALSIDENILYERINIIEEALLRLTNSNAEEINSLIKPLAEQLMNFENPITALEKVEEIFVKNHGYAVYDMFWCTTERVDDSLW